MKAVIAGKFEFDGNDDKFWLILERFITKDDETCVVYCNPEVVIPAVRIANNHCIQTKVIFKSSAMYFSDRNRFDTSTRRSLNTWFGKFFQKNPDFSWEDLDQFVFEGGVISDVISPSFKEVLFISDEEPNFRLPKYEKLFFYNSRTRQIVSQDHSIEEIEGDALSFEKWQAVAHCANLYHTMGAGIAKAISQKFPEALEADKKTEYGDVAKLGTFSKSEGEYVIYNVYGQEGIGNNGHPLDRNARYDALFNGLFLVFEDAAKNGLTVAIPYAIGCGLAGGDWKIVRQIIQSAWEQNPVKLYIVKKTD